MNADRQDSTAPLPAHQKSECDQEVEVDHRWITPKISLMEAPNTAGTNKDGLSPIEVIICYKSYHDTKYRHRRGPS